MAAAGSVVQGSPAGLVDISSLVNQLCRQLQITLQRDDHECAFSVGVEPVDVSFRPVDQHLGRFERRLAQCQIQAAATFRVNGIGIEAASEKFPDLGWIVTLNCAEKILVRSRICRTRAGKNKDKQQTFNNSFKAMPHAQTPVKSASKLRLVASAISSSGNCLIWAICCATKGT